jgi:hypothetical protein
MLFLAVFCAFLAEWKLEHTIEHQREKQYMLTMIEDLKSDSAMFEENFRLRRQRIDMIDSLVAFLGSPGLNGNRNNAYYYARSISPPLNIFPNDRTIQQLKNSGTMRLVRNRTISNSIMAYDQKVRQVQFEMGDEVEIRAEYRIIARKIFDTKVFHAIIAGDTISRPVHYPKLFSSDPALLNELIGAIQYTKRVHQALLKRSGELLTQAIQLMKEIKKEYHLSERTPSEK